MIDVVHAFLFTFLAVSAIAIIRLKDLFAAVMLMGIFSLLSASLFTVMDAVDVAFTEAAVGAGVSTILMLATLSMTNRTESDKYKRGQPLALVVVILTGAALVYATFDMPRYGDSAAPIHQAGVQTVGPHIDEPEDFLVHLATADVRHVHGVEPVSADGFLHGFGAKVPGDGNK